jgi:hypothetical protein
VDTAQLGGGQGADAAAAKGQDESAVVGVGLHGVLRLVGVSSFLVPVVVTG